MPDHGNPETYHLQAKQWRKKAGGLSCGKEREVYLVIAEGYARLALLIEKRVANAPAMLNPDINHG